MTVSADELSFTDFRAKAVSVLFIGLMYAIFQQRSVHHIRYTIIAVVFISVCNNMIELLNLRIFSEVNLGRPAGFYIDANQSGCGMMPGMLTGIIVIKKPYRWILVLGTGIGMMGTFSRGAILAWLSCSLLLLMGRVLSD